jgi:Leucine-rich repeat (LRR) protein
MKFTKLLSKLIIENARLRKQMDLFTLPTKTKEGKQKPAVMPFEVYKNIVKSDPTTKKPENFDFDGADAEKMIEANIQPGAYTQWMIKHFATPNVVDYEKGSREYEREKKVLQSRFLEDLYKLSDDLKKYDRNKNSFPQDKRDINKLTPDDVFVLTKDLSLEKTSKSDIKKSRAGFEHKGGEIVYDGGNWVVIKINGTSPEAIDAAHYYGGFHDHEKGESRWCTSSPGLTYAQSHLKQGPLYVVFPQDDGGKVGGKTGLPRERYQLHFQSNQYMDRDDRGINLVEKLQNEWNEMKEFFKPEFAQSLVSEKGSTNKLEVNYPDSSAGKYVGLYGFEDLFDSIKNPESIEQISINNKSSDKIALNIPRSISRFKNVTALQLSNIVKSLPEEVGELSDLQFLMLPNNPDLKTLPSSLGNLENLTFINLEGTNAKLPESISSRANSDDGKFYWIE